MKFFSVHPTFIASAIGVTASLPGVAGVSPKSSLRGDDSNQRIRNKRILSEGNLKGEEGIDPDLNKFVVNRAPSTSLFDDSGVVNPLIVNGVEVDPRRKYGFFVSIGGCGASLVAPNVILSAAHCSAITGPAILGLHMKTVDGAEEFENIEIIDFADSITHPQYSGNTWDNDYWVIRLAHDSQLYQDQIVELDSPSDGLDLTPGQDVTVIGMGTTSSSGGVPNVLQEVTVDYITNEDCCNNYDYGCSQITDNMMCAGRPGQDSCQGDSGGPIFDTATQKQVGIVSWGYGCADSRFPGVYSRISAQYDWINEHINNYSSNGTNPPTPKVPNECYNSPEFWYDSDGPTYHCGNSGCSNSFANGGITSNMACCSCGGGEIYTGTATPTPVPTPLPTPLSTPLSTPPPTPPPAATPCPGSTVEVDIVSDNYPGETTWTLTNKCDGEEVARGGPYDTAGILYSKRICVPDAEYSFVISDSWGDGICCGYGGGSFVITYNGDEVGNGGIFESFDEKTFGECESPDLVVAEYDASLQVPKCASVKASCTSGDLLDGKASNIEPNPSNSLDSCTDGSFGTYHADESIDAITVSAVGGSQLQQGGLAEIEAKVWGWSDGAYDTADFYYTANVDHLPVSWTPIGSISANGGGLRTLKIQYLLPDSPLQAVRVNFRYFGSPSSCSGGRYDDVDDLVFVVAPSSAKEARKPKLVAPLKAMQSTHCEMIGDKRRCEEVSVCKWKNSKGRKGGDNGCYPN
mmetsp:Transcript_13172/g.28436  ORF Transcript_13172/g.28436 Transcript_13172/m.28436 type:complete len:746 (+) Transcript_13172:167-2404(+)